VQLVIFYLHLMFYTRVQIFDVTDTTQIFLGLFGQLNKAYVSPSIHRGGAFIPRVCSVRLPAVGTLKRYSKALEYEYRVKTTALGTLK
jgi:hypothetical protein